MLTNNEKIQVTIHNQQDQYIRMTINDKRADLAVLVTACSYPLSKVAVYTHDAEHKIAEICFLNSDGEYKTRIYDVPVLDKDNTELEWNRLLFALSIIKTGAYTPAVNKLKVHTFHMPEEHDNVKTVKHIMSEDSDFNNGFNSAILYDFE